MFHRPKHLQRPHVEEYVVREIQPVVTHYVTNKVYRHVHQYPHTESFVNRKLPHHLSTYSSPGDNRLANRGGLFCIPIGIMTSYISIGL